MTELRTGHRRLAGQTFLLGTGVAQVAQADRSSSRVLAGLSGPGPEGMIPRHDHSPAISRKPISKAPRVHWCI